MYYVWQIVIGILAGSGPLGVSGGRTVVVPLRTAQAVFDQAGLTRVDIGLADGAAEADVVAGLESRLLVEPYVISSPLAPDATPLKSKSSSVGIGGR